MGIISGNWYLKKKKKVSVKMEGLLQVNFREETAYNGHDVSRKKVDLQQLH